MFFRAAYNLYLFSLTQHGNYLFSKGRVLEYLVVFYIGFFKFINFKVLFNSELNYIYYFINYLKNNYIYS